MMISVVAGRRPAMLILSTAAAVLVCWGDAAVAGENTMRAAGMGYLCLTLVLFACAFAFRSRVRNAEGAMYLRWCLVAAATLAASMGYAPSFLQGVFNTPPARFFQTACFNASEALYMLAAVLFFSAVARSVVIVDLLQALLFVVLRFNLVYSTAASDHFAKNHLLVGQLMALFLLVVALVGCLGAASRAELKFLRTLSWFFGLRLVAFFLANQVSYTWLHKQNCSLWDVPGPALLAAFSLYLIYSGDSHRVDAVEQASSLSPSVAVRSLMPAFLALANLMLGLFVLRISATLAAVAVSVSLVGYVLRTVMLQAQAVKEKALLQRRNEHLEGLAVRDPLTGIGNRRSLAGVYGELGNTGRGESVSLVLIDIDHFKQANDCHGHLYGDQVLVTLARKLERLAAAAAGSHCARLGGDEFAVLLFDVSPQKASAMAEELRVLFHTHAFGAGKANGSLSIGVASLSAATELPLEIFISYADEALYRAKMLGRNRVEAQPVWQPGTVFQDAGPAMRLKLRNS